MTEQKQRTWTEAPASWNIKYRINGFDEQITLRGESYSEIIEHVDKARTYVRKLLSASPSNHAADDALNVEPAAPQTPSTVAAPAAAQTSGGGTFRIVKMTVTPRSDGKTELQFFADGHKFPDVKAVKTPQDCALMLKSVGDWKPENFVAAHEYPIVCLIDWKPSENLNKNGQPYKNIVAVKPANA